MKNIYFTTLIALFSIQAFGQIQLPVYNTYQQEMDVAYQQYPTVPRGILEAVSYKMTHFSHVDDSYQESCFQLPSVSGVMGVMDDQTGYFRNNLLLISQLSGYSVTEIKTDPQKNILAYASAYSQLLVNMGISPTDINEHDRVITELSEIPLDHDPVNDYAMNARLYGVFSLLKGFNISTSTQVNLEDIFGLNNLSVLSSTDVSVLDTTVTSNSGVNYISQMRTSQYGPALWSASPTCNHSSRNGTAIDGIVIHTTQGSYAGSISWGRNCTSNVSFHYIIRSSDGQVTQMLLESKKGWHARSANPHTIGIEHEGYVNDASWYTNAMYTSSANLTRDITQSGYGILPTRTYNGPGNSGTSLTLGNCVRVKGHQHWPNQSHNDPGINWNWNKYYNLINNGSPTVATAATGSYFDTGGASGNYTDDERSLYLIQPTGASTVTLNFSAFSLENNWDYLIIYDGTTTASTTLATLTGTSIPSSITSTSGSILVEFRSDCATNQAGWALTWSSNGSGGSGGGADITPPSTSVAGGNNWETTNFTKSFTDADNSGGSGLKEKYYQVIDYNGTEWRANDGNGFLKDNFDLAIHGDWAQQTGSWSISNNALQQTDQTESNSNIYALLDQNISNQFLYNFTARIEGSGTNKRAGIHFMSDDGSLTNRSNSYFVYFRADNNKVQIYKVTGDVIHLEQEAPFSINDNVWYDYKITYDKVTGKIDAWIDNNHAISWTDTNPITGGDYISIRNGHCIFKIDQMNVYHGRGSSETVSVGAGSTNDLRFQNPLPSTSAGKIKSIVIDNQNNISSIGSKNVNVDWTPPSDVSVLNDGIAADISNTPSSTQLSANWAAATDVNSSITKYWYAIGTTAGGTNVRNWTDNWFNTDLTATGLSLTVGTTYYISIKAENGAGLMSNVISTDGQIVDNPSGTPTASFIVQNAAGCANDPIALSNNSSNASSYQWSVNGGATINNPTATNPTATFPSSGNYDVTLIATGTGGATDTDVQSIYVTVESAPVAAALLSDTLICSTDPMVTFTNQSLNADNYIWGFGDGTTSTDESPWHNYNNPGVFNVSLTAINGNCPSDVLFMTVEVGDCSGIKEENSLNLSVFPNPVSDELTILYRNSTNDNFSISLYDLTGRKVATLFEGVQSIGNQTLHFNIAKNNLAKGNYQLVFEGSTFNKVKSVIVK